MVVVTPRNYGTENAVTLDAIRQLGPSARGVAVVQPTVSSAVRAARPAGVKAVDGRRERARGGLPGTPLVGYAYAFERLANAAGRGHVPPNDRAALAGDR